MEESPKDILSPILNKPIIQGQLARLDDAVKEANKRIDYTVANDAEIQKAIQIVERFLRKKKRVCYGGQAINALLSKERKFYDEKYSIPDYDFFTPTYKEDSAELIEELKKEGFEDVNMKFSMHEGTSKILMNFIPVADCTDMHPSLFKIIQSRAKVVNGIYFADPEFLRMMMYVELSRPRGEVSRWKKVYERLTLLNSEYTPGKCVESIRVDTILTAERETILDLAIKRKRVLVGPECITLMQEGTGRKAMNDLVSMGGPIILLSPQAKLDGEDIADMLRITHHGHGKVTSEEVITLYSTLFNFTMVKHMKRPIALIFQEDACHSYNTLDVAKGITLRTGSHDLMLQLYYSIFIFGKKEKDFFIMPIQCLIEKLHAIELKARNKPSAYVPAFSIRCSGHQQGIATLLKERAKRTALEREKGGRRTRTRTMTKTRTTRRIK
jgi:hypothetical protein